MSEQAMSQLLRSFETLGYIVRSNVPEEGRARIIHFTKRGHAAYSIVHYILRDIEREWSTELAPKRFAQLLVNQAIEDERMVHSSHSPGWQKRLAWPEFDS
jgi:DNA-binding MarR family transcriptional regulator